jgi:hypothetical protein
MSPGFVYALINYSMPGLVKVGMTTRTTTERAAELSASTGVPTPFIVAFEVLVEDPAAAERQMHVELERAGYRLSPSREFFEAPLPSVINAMLSLGGETQPAREHEERERPWLDETYHTMDLDDLFSEGGRICIKAGFGSSALLETALGVEAKRALDILEQLEICEVLGEPHEPSGEWPLLPHADLTLSSYDE